jgi:hypothetical protein
MTYFATLPECRGVGLIVEIPGVHCQEKTYEELKETLGGYPERSAEIQSAGCAGLLRGVVTRKKKSQDEAA